MMPPSTPARSAVTSRTSTPNKQKAGAGENVYSTSILRSPAGPQSGTDWKARVRSITSYATPAAQNRRRTVSEQKDNRDTPETPSLSYADTPSTVSSVGSSLPITPASPTYHHPRNSKNVGYVPSNLHSRHHTSPLHRATGLADESFDESYEQDVSFDDGVGIYDMMPQSAAAKKLRLGTLQEESAKDEPTRAVPQGGKDWSTLSETSDSPVRWRQDSEASSYADQTEDEDATSAKTVTPVSTPPRNKARTLSSGSVPHFYTPPPANARGRTIIPIAPATAAPAVRAVNRRSLSPFYEHDEPRSTNYKTIPKPRFAGLSSAQRGSPVSGGDRAIPIKKPQSPTPASAKPATLLGSHNETVRAITKLVFERPTAVCGCCEDEIKKDGVKISPCACVVCKQCFTSGMNVVCDVAGGVMRCPSCTTTVDDFSTFSPKKNDASKALVKTQTKTQTAMDNKSNLPVILRFDNASWDVTPEMIVNFLPEGALADSSQNPHPIHLLINPFDGKTKDFFFVEVVSKKAAATVIKCCQSTVLGEGKRARPVTITLSNLHELQREIQPTSARALSGVLDLCSTAFSTKKSYIKRKSFPFLYLMTILTRANLKGFEIDLLVVFQGATLIISNLLESGAASPSELALARGLYSVLLQSPLLTPVVCGPFIGVMPGPAHPLNRPMPPQMPHMMFNPAGMGYNGMGMMAPANVGPAYMQHQHQQQMFAMQGGSLRI